MEESKKQEIGEQLAEEYQAEELYRTLPVLKDATPKEIALAAVSALDFKRGRDIKLLYVEDKTVLADYFVLCSGTSNTHVKSLLNEVEYRLGLRGLEPHHVEGRDNGSWAIADYSSVIVHVFSREARSFYDLDKLYGGLPVKEETL